MKIVPTIMPMQKIIACVAGIPSIMQTTKKMTPSQIAIIPMKMTNLLVRTNTCNHLFEINIAHTYR